MPETNFFWDPLSDSILQERGDAGTVTAEYTTEPSLYGNVVSQYRGGVESQFHFDAQGSTVAVSGDSQGVTDARAYSAFGVAVESIGSTQIPFLYAGQEGYYNLGVSAEYSVRRRTYDPNVGYWLTVDSMPYLEESGVYVYVANDPINYLDPSGMLRRRRIGCRRRFRCPAPPRPRPLPEEEFPHSEVDIMRRCWTVEDWRTKCKQRGQTAPGHDPKDFPEGFPGLPIDFGPQPIWWGVEVARGLDLSNQMPNQDDLDAPGAACTCLPPYTEAHRARPRGRNGQYPIPGQPRVDCEVGQQVIMKYPAVCKGKDDDPCKGPWKPECVRKSCSEVTWYECKMGRQGTIWATPTQPPEIRKPSTVRTKCK